MPPSNPRNAGWDPWLIISQIVSMQSIHYLTLCLLVPPLLTIIAEPNALAYEGGAASVAVIMDWREMSSRPTVHGLHGQDHRGWDAFAGAYSGGKKVGVGFVPGQTAISMWDGRVDPRRGWCIALCWLLASIADVYYLYAFVRRPRLILDFALTLVLNHFVLTTYYSGALPSSPFFWCVIVLGACLTTFLAEQLCVRREMREGLAVGPWTSDMADGIARAGVEANSMELGQLRRD
ncbi:hypothetical protein K439DRAFT_1632639 [Ramaria rubella]|nr:hypothetical protein K439DRAFT_1632639 [Ramaria rubella]